VRSLASVKANPHERLFLRKIEKGFDEHAFELAAAQRKIESLEAAPKLEIATRRKKVQVDPNTTFAGIAEIRATQHAAGRDLDESPDFLSSFESEIEDSIEFHPGME
jgi:hypothetical protein